MVTVGLLYPGHSAEDDYAALDARLDGQVRLPVVITSVGEDALVPDTAMHTLAIVDELEAAVGKPVLTANQVTVWKGLQLVGPVPRLAGLGALFRIGAPR